MDIKEYRVEPDKGLYEKIERRVAQRRMWRWTATALTVVAVVGTALMLWVDHDTPASTPQVATVPSVTTSPSLQLAAEPAPTVAESQKQTVAMAEKSVEVAKPGRVEDLPIHLASEYTPSIVEQNPTLEPAQVQAVSHDVAELILGSEQPAVETEVASVEESNAAMAPTSQVATSAKGSSTVHYENVFTAPNIIVPQGEVDENRRFKLFASSSVTSFHMAIYNRGGRQVFSTDNINEAWDGTYKGRPVTQGSYVWVASFRDSDGKPRSERGTVTVVQ